MKKLTTFLITIAAVFTLAACSNSNAGQHNSNNQSAIAKTRTIKKVKPKLSSTPTLFFHGLLGSYKTEEYIANYAKRSGATNSVTRANVSQNGKVKLVGKIKKNAVNPLIEVNYADNFQTNFAQNGIYATNVVKALQKKYGIKTVNMIGYSLGNMSIIHYQLKNGNNPKMPQLVVEMPSMCKQRKLISELK